MAGIDKTFAKRQKLTIFTLWLTYSFFYLGRVNLAVALPVIEQNFGWTSSTTGLVSSSFFWVYAFGQLINGALGDQISARYFVFAGLLGTAFLNLLFGFGTTLAAMALIWGLNGIFQSTGWGPIIKTASSWTGTAERNRVSAILGTSFVLGSLFSWLLAGALLERYGKWELVFFVPAVVLFFLAWFWLAVIRDEPGELGFTVNYNNEGTVAKPSAKDYLKDTVVFLRQPHFILLALTTIFQGMIKDGINLWLPTLLMQTQNLSIGSAVSYSLIVPILGFVGVLFASWLNGLLKGNERLSIIILFCLGGLFSTGVVFFFGRNSTLLLSLLIGLCSLVINGINLLLLTTIPLRFAHLGKTSTLAGFLDFASYVGSGTMTIITGFAAYYWGWQSVAILWVALFLLGFLSTLLNKDLGQEAKPQYPRKTEQSGLL